MANISVSQRAMQVLGETSPDDLVRRQFNYDYGQVPLPMQMRNDLSMYHKHGLVRSIYTLDSGMLVVVDTLYDQTIHTIFLLDELPEQELKRELPTDMPLESLQHKFSGAI